MDAKFETLAKNLNDMSADEVKQSLAKAPAADEGAFFHWLIQARTKTVDEQLKAKPASNAALSEAIKKTDFKDPTSVLDLQHSITGLVPPEPLRLGKSGGSTPYLYSIGLGQDLLPQDVDADPGHLDTSLTYLQTNPASSALPGFFYQLGRLQSMPATETDVTKAADTHFVVAVNVADKKAWALWNPAAAQELAADFGADAYQHRPTSGTLPGLSEKCSAVPLEGTIDSLLPASDTAPPKTLSLDSTKFVTLPSTTTIKFGGVDKAGWDLLVKVSQKYADAAKLTQKK